MKRILGVDFGSARTGVAASDELQMLAFPVETIATQNPVQVARRISEIAREKEAGTIVVGVPRHMNGELGTSATAAMELAEKIRDFTTCDVVTWDERLSTVAAARALRETGKSTRQTRGIVDQVAAQMILQGYLDRAAAKQFEPSAE